MAKRRRKYSFTATDKNNIRSIREHLDEKTKDYTYFSTAFGALAMILEVISTCGCPTKRNISEAKRYNFGLMGVLRKHEDNELNTAYQELKRVHGVAFERYHLER